MYFNLYFIVNGILWCTGSPMGALGVWGRYVWQIELICVQVSFFRDSKELNEYYEFHQCDQGCFALFKPIPSNKTYTANQIVIGRVAMLSVVSTIVMAWKTPSRSVLGEAVFHACLSSTHYEQIPIISWFWLFWLILFSRLDFGRFLFKFYFICLNITPFL